MHAHTCTGPCVHKSVHAQVQRPELTLSVFSTAFQFIFQWWVSPRTWTSLILASLANQVALGISSLCSWSVGIAGNQHISPVLTRVLGTWTLVLTLVQCVLHLVSRLPRQEILTDYLCLSLLPQISCKSIIHWNNLFERSMLKNINSR